MEMTKQEATKVISEKMAQITTLLSSCQDVADENEVSFSFDVAGYGMGGRYYGEKDRKPDEYGSESDGWSSSSANC